MARGAGPYVTWLSAAAGQAAQTAGQARLAAGAFEEALAATVHPIVVADNRTRLVSLVRSNLLGQNAPAIAAADAEYEQMWARDVAAMSGYYAGASAATARLTQWQELLTGIFNLGNGNIGVNNVGVDNIGFNNIGNGNVGIGNFGNGNIGIQNFGNWNVGIGNTGNRIVGFGLPGDGNVGVALINENQVGAGGTAETALLMGGTGLSPLPKPGFAPTAERFITPTYPPRTPRSSW
jgi:PPE-repeat protein